mgnify:CR=1 FL=1
MTNTNTTNNKYGHLLDKYLEPDRLDWKTRQRGQRNPKIGMETFWTKRNLIILHWNA